MDFSVAFEETKKTEYRRKTVSDHLRGAFERTNLIPCFWRTYSHGIFGDASLVRNNWGVTRTCPACLQRELDLLSLSSAEEVEEEEATSVVTYYVLWCSLCNKAVPLLLSPTEASVVWLYITNLHGIPSPEFKGLDHNVVLRYENGTLRVRPGTRSKCLFLKSPGAIDVKRLFELWWCDKVPRLKKIISDEEEIELYPLYFITKTAFGKVVRGFFIPLYFHYLKNLPLTGWNIVHKYYDKFGINYDDLTLIAEAVYAALD